MKQLFLLAFLADTSHCLQFVHCRWWVALWWVPGENSTPCSEQKQAEVCWKLQASPTDLQCSCAPGAAVSLRGKGRRLLSATSDQCLPGVLRPWGLWLNCTCSSCHFSLERTPLWGRVEIQTKKKKTDAPRRSQCGQPGPSEWVSGYPHLPAALSRSQSCCSSTACPWGYLVDSPSYCLQWRCHSQKLKDYYFLPSL